jgi:hypothetical protein
MTDLASRLVNRVQLTTDGHHAYLTAVDAAFHRDSDYAQLVKVSGTAPEAGKRYSPPICLSADKTEIRGRPDPEHISTSYVERQNLNDAHEHEAVYQIDKWFLEEVRESLSHDRALCFLVQLHSNS